MRITLESVVIGGAILLAVVLISQLLRRRMLRLVEGRSDNYGTVYAAARVVQYSVIALGVLWALQATGVPLTELQLVLGAMGIGVGFGLQSIIANFISGLILLFDRSLKVGDFVEVAGNLQGEVRGIRLRATYVRTNDNVDILVPNSEFINGNVVNWTHNDAARRLRVPFSVAYGTDKELVREAALAAAASVPFADESSDERAAQVWLTAMGESSLDFELVVWLTPQATKRPSAVEAAYTWALHSALTERGIEIPFPQRDLHVRTILGRTDAAVLAGSVSHAESAADEPSAHPAQPARQEGSEASENDALGDAERAIRDDERRLAERTEGED